MPTQSKLPIPDPTRHFAKLKKIIEAWELLAPSEIFGGMSLAGFRAAVAPSLDNRAEAASLRAAIDAAVAERITRDEASTELLKLVTAAVKGDPFFGETSPLYRAMGFNPGTFSQERLLQAEQIPVPPVIGISSEAPEGIESVAAATGLAFTITRSGDIRRDGQVAWEVLGETADPAAAADFVGGELPAGIASFSPGEATKIISIPVADDAADEPTEGFSVKIETETRGIISETEGAASGAIINDDDPFADIGATPAVVTEDGEPASFLFTIELDRPSHEDLVLGLSWSGSAAAGVDIETPPASISIPRGSISASFSLEVLGDVTAETDETFQITIQPGEGYRLGETPWASITIDDDDLRPWTPLDASGRLLWLDATASGSFTLSETNVLAWRDRTENGIVFVPADGATSFAQKGTFNIGLNPSVYFDSGTNHLLSTSAGLQRNIEGLPRDTAITESAVFIVMRTNGAPSNFGEVLRGEGVITDTLNTYRAVYIGGGSAGPRFQWRAPSTRAQITYTQAQGWNGGAANHLLSLTANRSTPINQVFEAGALKGTNTAAYTMRVGAHDRLGGGSLAATGAQAGIGEVLVFSTVPDTSTRQRIEGYLAHKWQIPLVAGHPYQNAAPMI